MASNSSVKGVNRIIRNINLSKIVTKKSLDLGLNLGGLYLQRKSQRIVPVEDSVLKNSAFTRRKGEEVFVGYTAEYALFVHEAPMKLKGKPRSSGKGSYWDPQGVATNKFLEGPVRDSKIQSEILRIVERTVELI